MLGELKLKAKLIYMLTKILIKIYIPGKSWADEPNKTQSPVSKLADLQVAFRLHNSIQSVNIKVPGLESNISSGAV